MDTSKRLFRSTTDKVFAGICGGIGERFLVDPVILRLIWLLVVVFTGFVPGLLAYIVAIYIIPLQRVVPEETASISL